MLAENMHLKQELKLCEAQLQELRKHSARCTNCAHSQVRHCSSGWPSCRWACSLGTFSFLPQENVKLQEKLAQVKQEAEDVKGRLSELDLEVEQKTNRLAEVELRLKDSLAERAEEEERLSRRLRDSQEVIASLKAQPHQVKVRMALCSAQGQFFPSSQLWGVGSVWALLLPVVCHQNDGS